MNIAIINVLAKSKSTGKIAYSLYKYLISQGHKVIICYGRNDEDITDTDHDCIEINTKIGFYVDTMKSKLFNNEGFNSKRATLKLIEILRSNNIQAMYLLNIHDHFINQPMLYRYLIDSCTKVIYLMIDEYAYLGNCCYPGDCDQFKTKCKSCPTTHTIFQKIHNHPDRVFELKRSAYEALKRQMTFVGIQYAVNRAKESKIMPSNAKYAVIDEAVDLRKTYYPRSTDNLRNKLGISSNKIICVLVAPFSNPRKGAIYYRQAAEQMKYNSEFVFVHVGYDGKIEDCPQNYIPIPYVSDQNELAEYYSLGDVFVCTSLAETIPATCLEALACGTPLIGFDISGTPYCSDAEHGTFVEARNVNALVKAIKTVPKKTKERSTSCREYAKSRFDAHEYNAKLEKLLYE